jgi:hypothetical protein
MNVSIDFDWVIQIKLGVSLIIEIINRLWSYIFGGYERQGDRI